MVRISDSGLDWKKALTSFVGQPFHKNNSSAHYHQLLENHFAALRKNYLKKI